MKKNIKVSLILNSIIIFLFIFGLITGLLGFQWMGINGNLTPDTNNYLWFFTIDSNILLVVASIILVIYEVLMKLKKVDELPRWVIVYKYVAVSATTLTLVTVMLYLSPLLGLNFWKLFLNNNLFFHLVSPVLGLVSFIFYENKDKLHWKVSFLALIPMGLYSIFYIINVYTHLNNGQVDPKYDFYYFASKGILMTVVMVFVMLIFAYGSAILIYFLREKRRQKESK